MTQVRRGTTSLWDVDDVQFPRLLAEIHAVGLKPGQVEGLCVSMDLGAEQLAELFARAEKKWEAAKALADERVRAQARRHYGWNP